MENAVKNRYDFLLLFDVKDGNPNGDPDAGNLPRVDAETGLGLVTDVCLKRKVRNYIQLVKNNERPFDIYVKEKAVLGRAHIEAFKTLGISTGEEKRLKITDEEASEIEELLSLTNEDLLLSNENEDTWLVLPSTAELKTIKDKIKEISLSKAMNKKISDFLKGANTRKPSADEVEKGREWMCKKYYDIRTFGAVMSLKQAPNCGQVRGPIQITFARSIDPIVASEHSITRMAVATEAEAEKQKGDNRTMGRKYTVPYGLYKAQGFISANLALQTGFSEEDLSLFWDALQNMFEHDRSAARGMMSTCKLIVFKHNSVLGNAHAQKLFDLVKVQAKDPSVPARSFDDYNVTIDYANKPESVEIIEMV